ncbi:hypothetical protein [Variovorax sp. LT1R16]|uniref:hypothetical protein n=1 Tax=Variovorax sp. LT1R16 TaxID=3443728 RepID=UPI003F477C8F
MDWVPLAWATLGATFSASCFGLYARLSAAASSFDRDLMVLAAVGASLGMLTVCKPHWMW